MKNKEMIQELKELKKLISDLSDKIVVLTAKADVGVINYYPVVDPVAPAQPYRSEPLWVSIGSTTVPYHEHIRI